MRTIQGSTEISVSITRLYIQLTQFEDYPRFLEDVQSVRQLSKTRLHWAVKSPKGPFEWESEITEQEANSHIAWHDVNDGRNNGRIDMEELGPNLSRVSIVLERQPGSMSGICAGVKDEDIAQCLNRDLAHLKEFMEGPRNSIKSQEPIATEPDPNDLDEQTQADLMNRGRESSMRRTPASMSGSPTEVLEDEPNESSPGMPNRSGEETNRSVPRAR